MRGEILPFPPRANTMAVRTADLPEPFSPERNVTLWLGWKVNFYKNAMLAISKRRDRSGLTS